MLTYAELRGCGFVGSSERACSYFNERNSLDDVTFTRAASNRRKLASEGIRGQRYYHYFWPTMIALFAFIAPFRAV